MSFIKYYLIYVFLSFLVTTELYTQNSYNTEVNEKPYFFSLNYGIQMSGIKDEDFIRTNYSPLLNITAGKWFTQQFALQIGYKGFYFNTIADKIKHYYNYFYGEVLINFSNLIYPNRLNKNWYIILHAGPGYFYNHVHRSSDLCINIGLQNNFHLTNQFQATLDLASIIGWDIYQGDEDILPGITIGVRYLFYCD